MLKTSCDKVKQSLIAFACTAIMCILTYSSPMMLRMPSRKASSTGIPDVVFIADAPFGGAAASYLQGGKSTESSAVHEIEFEKEELH